ncbi:adenylosuccinate lyase [Candidatus Bathyarchaeota archaeon]|nr:adenylosuccinate lyase [Candidatus Bathyarchaeota archaeon]
MNSQTFDFNSFLSVFTWRYGSEEMRRIFSEVHSREVWRRVWSALADGEAVFGIISKEEAEDIRSKAKREYIDIDKAHELERKIKHDVMAELKVFAEQCPVGGGKLHLGATSMDITDNADIIRFREALEIILGRILNCLNLLCDKILRYKDLPCIGWTHLQPAEPTTLGYRFANYAQDLTVDILMVESLLENVVKGKGVKGAVGTASSFTLLIGDSEKASTLEKEVMRRLNLRYYLVSTQTYPRKVDYLVLSTLASVAQSAHKFALDIRVLQSPVFGELSEPIGEMQVGSSAMPFKRNPVKSERMCSLARYVGCLPLIAWSNASSTVLERTLDDSANRRIIIPEAFLAADECLILYGEVLEGLNVYPEMIKRNLRRFGPFAGTEAILMKLSSRGMSRQEAHEKLRRHSFKAWEKVMAGEENPLPEMLKRDPEITALVRSEEIDESLEPSKHVGDAPERCELFVEKIAKPILDKYKPLIKSAERTGF